MKISKIKAPKHAHTSDSQKGMGDYYGSGIKQKVGRMREDYINMTQSIPSKLKKPPKSLA